MPTSPISPTGLRADYYARHALLPPDWRWRIAEESLQVTSGPRPRDCTCRRLAEYMEGGSHWLIDPTESHQFSLHPILTIFNAPLKRLSLEARILAYRDPALAAELCGNKPQTVVDYCTVFFDVLHRLDAKRAIDAVVIRADRYASDLLRRILYHHAYFGGPVVAEHWLAHLGYLGGNVEHDLGTPVGIAREQLDVEIASQDPAIRWDNPKHVAAQSRLLCDRPAGAMLSDLIHGYHAHILQQRLSEAPLSAVASETLLREAA